MRYYFGSIFVSNEFMLACSSTQLKKNIQANLFWILIALAASSSAQGQSDSIRMEMGKSEVQTRKASRHLGQEAHKTPDSFQTVKSDGFTPVPFVTVFNKNSGQSVMTDVNGNASVTRSARGDTLIFQSIGFIDKVLYPESPIPDKILLVEDLVSLGTAEVVSQGLVDAQDASLSMQVDGVISIPRAVVPLEVPQTSAELLWSTGSVMVQQSQQGGGSPILRGFEANRILLVVDGVRMNNAIYRSGHLQNAITVDSQVLERTDVLLGPNSILFGSDALGGVIHYHTRIPKVGVNDVKIRASTAYRTPNSSRSGHVDIEVSRPKWASLTSISRSVYGDLQMGSWRAHGDAFWGLDSLYVDRINGKDSMFVNDSPEIQMGSGYEQMDFLQKFRIRTGAGTWDVNFQSSTSSNVPRYDVSGDWSNDQLKWAEWDYGPQKRALASAKYARQLKRWNMAWETQIAMQQIEESRIKRRFGEDWREIQTENVRVLNGYSTLNKRWFSGLTVTVGLSAATDDVTSAAKQVHLAHADSVRTAMTRYPSGGSKLHTQGVFATAQWPWKAHRVAAGIRWSQSQMNAQFLQDERYTLPFDRLKTHNGALTGGVSAQWNGLGPWGAMTSLSTGFRHPNVDDVGKVREKGGFVMIPNDSLNPEYLTSLEQGVTWNLQNRNILLITLTGFSSFLNQAIVPEDATLNGATMFWIDGDSARIQTHVNSEQALIVGGRVEIQAQLSEKCGFETAVNWTWGRQVSKHAQEPRPMAHIPPVFGRIALDYNGPQWSVEGNVLFSARKAKSNFGGFATDNLELMLPTGAPAWWTFNLESELQLHPTVALRLGIRNIFDMHYRVFASGISAAGRGLYLSLNASF